MRKPGSREKKPGFRALGGTRTPNLLIRSQMLYPLSYKREEKLMNRPIRSISTGDLLEFEEFQTNALLLRWCLLPRQLPYLIRFATCGLGVVRGGDERI